MKIGYQEICINPLKPIKQAGFIQQVDPVSEVHDDLHARILGLKDSKKEIYLCSLDNLGVSEGLLLQNKLMEDYRKLTDQPIEVVISCTHTHFAPYAKDKTYFKQLYKYLMSVLKNFTFRETRLFISREHVFFDEVGKSRISNHETPNIYLDVFSIFDKEKRLGALVVYNCHPTILSGDTPYFSSEYPGFMLKQLKEKYPDEFFTFYQGAAGDISSRFTRKTQDYSSVEDLGTKLANKVEELLAREPNKCEIENIKYEKHIFSLEHEMKPIDISHLPDNLTDREKETIEIGQKMRERYIASKKALDQEIMLSKLTLGTYQFIFNPKETFSSYINALNLDKSVLICYSNGYSPYIVDIGFKGITYEMFTDTTTEETKIRFYKLLEKLGK